MAQWLGNTSRIIYNDRGCGGRSPTTPDRYCSLVVDVDTGERVAELPMPIFSVDFQGR